MRVLLQKKKKIKYWGIYTSIPTILRTARVRVCEMFEGKIMVKD